MKLTHKDKWVVEVCLYNGSYEKRGEFDTFQEAQSVFNKVGAIIWNDEECECSARIFHPNGKRILEKHAQAFNHLA